MLQHFAKFKRFWVDTENSNRWRRGRVALTVLALGVVWFIPWVLTVPVGFSIYLPYEADPSAGRRVEAVGPVAALLGLSKWASAEEIPSACTAAVVAAEDTRFYEHWGIDFESLQKAWNDRNSRRRARGASTLTQQLVKNLYLSRTRSYLRKAREAVGAVLLEGVASKEHILTWYLNVVEFGPDVYGITEASRFYFRKEPQDLKPFECVALSVILPSPKKWNSSLVRRNYTSFFQRRYGVVLARMGILRQVPARVLSQARTGAPFWVATPRKPGAGEGGLPGALPDLPELPDLLQDEDVENGGERAEESAPTEVPSNAEAEGFEDPTAVPEEELGGEPLVGAEPEESSEPSGEPGPEREPEDLENSTEPEFEEGLDTFEVPDMPTISE